LFTRRAREETVAKRVAAIASPPEPGLSKVEGLGGTAEDLAKGGQSHD